MTLHAAAAPRHAPARYPVQGGPRDPWPDWWADADVLVAARCRALWASVLTHCLCDSIAALVAAEAGQRRRREPHGADAYWWRSPSMREVATLAGFDADALQGRLQAMLARDGAAKVLRELRGTKGQGRRYPAY